MKNLKFEDLPKALEMTLVQLSIIQEELQYIKDNLEPKKPIELLSRQETAEYLKINITTLWNWTNKGKLNAYGIGNRVYYKRSEIEQSLIKIN
ncbi:helix-turn-helix domain-containing protein [Pontimicrobium sp. IMCC45349]|uniref:helix-turn-helix domain-containing protein n=1 Tax=Pontimicrobium sp. IMCC45349 TaxID=3391574 RepID=UPI00399FA146